MSGTKWESIIEKIPVLSIGSIQENRYSCHIMEIRFPIPRMKTVVVVLGVLLGLATIFLIVEFQPKRQLEKSFGNLVSAVEKRDWKQIEALLAPDYADAWGMNREQAIQVGSEVLRHFFVLEIVSENPEVQVSGMQGAARTVLRVNGNGTAVAQSMMAEANALDAPFVFEWHRASWKPWDWKLKSLSNIQVHFDAARIYGAE